MMFLFIINLQHHPPLLFPSGIVHVSNWARYPPVDDDSDCYPWTTVWEDSLIFRLLY